MRGDHNRALPPVFCKCCTKKLCNFLFCLRGMGRTLGPRSWSNDKYTNLLGYHRSNSLSKKRAGGSKSRRVGSVKPCGAQKAPLNPEAEVPRNCQRMLNV